MIIYTRTGDRGQTSLATGERVSKTDMRLEAYGTADELNSWVGLLRASTSLQQSTFNHQQSELEWIQQRLFNIGAGLAGAQGEWISEDDILQLEKWIDVMLKETPPTRAFVLPSGGESVCRAHVCRTVARRLERRILATNQVDSSILKFVNRLSDYLFVLAEFLARKGGENPQIWEKNAKCQN